MSPKRNSALYYQAISGYQRLHPDMSYPDIRRNPQFRQAYRDFQEAKKSGNREQLLRSADQLGIRHKFSEPWPDNLTQ